MLHIRVKAWFHNPQKKVQGILKKIKNGQASETTIASLAELLDEQPSMVPEVVRMLTDLMRTGDTKTCSLAISALSIETEKNPDLAADSLDAILCCIRKGKKELCEDLLLSSIEILARICQKYPERMSSAVPELFACLENISTTVREKAYFLLALIAVMQPCFFRGRSKELIRVLNGLNMDERIYACRLIKRIADKDPKIVEDTFNVLEDLCLYDPHSTMRSEAAYALETLKARVATNSSISDIEVGPIDEIVLCPPDENDIKDVLEGLKLSYLINKK